MKLTKILSTAMLFLLPGAIATVYAQEHEEKPAEHQQPAKAAQKPEKAKPAQKQQAQHKPSEQQPKAKPAQESQHAARTRQAKPAQQQPRGQKEQASRGAKATGGHGSIPEARYNASFGSSHTFHVNESQFHGGSGRFQYGGYWFNAVNPWPVGWLYTDSVYVAYLNGGYFLCNPFHPGVYISINIG